MLGVLVGATLLGGLLGSQIVAPNLFAAQVSVTAETSPAHSAGGGSHEEHPQGVTHQIEDIIVNPAGSEGMHFLMATVVIEVPSSKVEHHLREQEVRVRDRVLSILEDQSMEMLTRQGARDSLKRQIADAIRPMTGDAEWLSVYIPEFVIQ
jgi:flagellar basal body-associated protein FliL